VYLLIFEFLGTNELVVILVVALILLGPRRLPQMTRKMGKSLAEFKRASEDFKRTWEKEVEMDSADKDARIERAMLPAENSILDTTVERSSSSSAVGADFGPSPTENQAAAEPVPAPTITPVDASVMQPLPTTSSDAPPAVTAPTRKRDWL
jgi:Tat protein translocase TatB subunit